MHSTKLLFNNELSNQYIYILNVYFSDWVQILSVFIKKKDKNTVNKKEVGEIVKPIPLQGEGFS